MAKLYDLQHIHITGTLSLPVRYIVVLLNIHIILFKINRACRYDYLRHLLSPSLGYTVLEGSTDIMDCEREAKGQKFCLALLGDHRNGNQNQSRFYHGTAHAQQGRCSSSADKKNRKNMQAYYHLWYSHMMFLIALSLQFHSESNLEPYCLGQ